MDAIRLMGHRPGVELMLAGVGGSTWENANLPMPVRRAGYITDDRLMAALYSCVDMIVVPSTIENLPNTLLEAMACGLPAVAVDAGGMRDAVVDGVTGFLVGQGDVASLAARMGQLLDDQNTRDEMGREARRHILKDFSSSIQAERFSALYEDVLSRRGRLPK